MESHNWWIDVLLVDQANNPDVMVTAYAGHIFPTELTEPIHYALMASIDSEYQFSSLQRVVKIYNFILAGS